MRGADRFSLHRRVRVVFAAAVTVAVLAAIVGGLALRGVLDARTRLQDQVDPALFQAERLQSSLLAQEAGIRAYVLVRDEAVLAPYRNGVEEEQRAAGRLRTLLSEVGSTDVPLEVVFAAVERWRVEEVEPTFDAVRTGDADRSGVDSLLRGEARFDEVRDAVSALEAELERIRRDARRDTTAATTRLIAALVIGPGFLLAGVGALWRLIRHDVERPLDRLRDDARLVAGGEIDHPVEAVGPTELRELGLAMEAMRARIAAELHDATAARTELEQRTEELARSNAELEQFAYVASHDLQEPLRKVASFCQLLQSRYGGQLDERADQYIGFAVDGAKRMQALINDLLSFSRVGRISRPFERVSLESALDQALGNLGQAIEESGAVVEHDPLPVVSGEAGLLVAVLQNLVGNAIKFRRPGTTPTVRITHRVVEAAADGDGGPAADRPAHHELVVSDDGIGIDAQYAERVFIIFQRLHAKEEYAGTGIGLALCRKIIEHHGGRIWIDTGVEPAGAPQRCERPPPSGTAIHLTLPLVEEPT